MPRMHCPCLKVTRRIDVAGLRMQGTYIMAMAILSQRDDSDLYLIGKQTAMRRSIAVKTRFHTENNTPVYVLTIPYIAHTIVDGVLTDVPDRSLHEDAASERAHGGVNQGLMLQENHGQAGEGSTVDGQRHEGHRIGDYTCAGHAQQTGVHDPAPQRCRRRLFPRVGGVCLSRRPRRRRLVAAVASVALCESADIFTVSLSSNIPFLHCFITEIVRFGSWRNDALNCHSV